VPTRAVAWAAVGLVATTLVAYHNSFSVPFVFDDFPAIIENISIRKLWPLSGVLAPETPGGVTTSGRPVVNLSLALNYAVSGTAVWSYHAVNLAIHLVASLALFGLVRRTLLTPGLSHRFGAAALPLAFFSAALWAAHPLQTESVTYVVQRAESLVGMFYVLTLYCFVRGAEAGGRPRWLLGAVVACTVGMATKEVMVSAPLIVLLYDRAFLSGTFRAAWAARMRWYGVLAATWVLLALLVVGTAGRGGTAGFGADVSAWNYALTQCRAITTYLGLSLWPQPLVFDYGLATVGAFSAVLPQALLVLVLLATAAVLVVRRPAVGFLGACFFALLAPSSSFVPVVTQTMAEHRMYLPLAAVIVAGVLGAYVWVGRRSLWFWGGLALACVGATVARNHDYRSNLAIWADTAEKCPGNARAHNNLGQALFRAGRIQDSVTSYREALRLQPHYPETHYNLGVSLAQLGTLPEALGHYEAALRIQPNYPAAHNNFANALVRVDRVPEALRHYEEAVRWDPSFAEAHGNRGNALLQSGRAEESVEWFARALALKPDSAECHYNLGNAYAALNRMPAALEAFRAALRLRPDYADAQVNTGNALLQLGRSVEAIAAYERAIALRPDLAVARFNLGSALLDLGRWAEAVAHFERSLELNAHAPDSHRALGFALVQLGRTREAIGHYEAVLRTEPADAESKRALAELRLGLPAR